MLYLIEDRDYLKIGYTSNLKQRLTSYRVENCYCQLIDSKPGTRKDETKLHALCAKWYHQGEWFKNTPEVKEIWNNYIAEFPEFKIMDECNQKIIDLIYNAKTTEDFAIRYEWKRLLRISLNYNFKSLESSIKEINDPNTTKIWDTCKALDTWLHILTYNDYRNFKYDFGKIQVEIEHHKEKDSIIRNTKTTFSSIPES